MDRGAHQRLAGKLSTLGRAIRSLAYNLWRVLSYRLLHDRLTEGCAIASSKVKLGAGASAAAGPKGRDVIAATDVTLRAEVLSYSRSRGLFAGAFLDGSTLRPDNDANKRLYHRRITAKEIVLRGTVSPPSAAEELLSELNKRSPKNLSS